MISYDLQTIFSDTKPSYKPLSTINQIQIPPIHTTSNTLSPIYQNFFILSFVKYQYHAKIDDQIDKALLSMTTGLINKLVSVLEATLGKLGRYDEGSLIGSFLSFTVRSFELVKT
jgi:hypothetical protein